MIRKLLAEGSYCRGVKAGRQWPCSGNGEEHRDTTRLERQVILSFNAGGPWELRMVRGQRSDAVEIKLERRSWPSWTGWTWMKSLCF